jgi:hypothetical protein
MSVLQRFPICFSHADLTTVCRVFEKLFGGKNFPLFPRCSFRDALAFQPIDVKKRFLRFLTFYIFAKVFYYKKRWQKTDFMKQQSKVYIMQYTKRRCVIFKA